MPHYAFKIVDQHNRLVEGSSEAPSLEVATEHLLHSGQTILNIREVSASRIGPLGPSLFSSRAVSDRMLAELLAQCRMLMNAGTPLEKALLLIARAKGQRDSAALADRLQHAVKGGKSFAQALSQIGDGIPPFVINAIKAGESSGRLDDVLDRVVSYMERARKVRAEIKDALVYPAILCVMAAISVAILMLVLVPQFKPLFDGAQAKIPPITRFILGASDYFLPFVVCSTAALVGSALALKVRLRDNAKRIEWDRLKITAPFGVGGTLRDAQLGIFSRLMSLLLQNGIPASRALALTRDAIPNRGFAADIDAAREHIEKGGRLYEGLQSSRFLSSEALDLITVGEEASNLDGVLSRIADMSEEQLERSTKRLMDIFVPALTVAIGVLIAAIVGAILMALLSINQLALR